MIKPAAQLVHPLCYKTYKMQSPHELTWQCVMSKHNPDTLSKISTQLVVYTGARTRMEVIYLPRNSTTALSDSPIALRHNHKWFLFATRKKKLQAEDGPAAWLPNHPVWRRGVFSAWGKCLRESLYHAMTLGWEALHHFLCTNKTKWLATARPPLRWWPWAFPWTLPYPTTRPTQPETWWSKVTLHPVWQRSVVKGRWAQSAASSGSSDCDKTLPLNIYGLACRRRTGGHCNVTP